jgi:hypothetical protein
MLACLCPMGADLADNSRRIAFYVDKILKEPSQPIFP